MLRPLAAGFEVASIDVSVVAPFYNTERYIRPCIEGLLQQDYPRDAYEIIMVDNNSTDGSARIAAEYPEIQVLVEPKQGEAVARNRGIRKARGDVIASIDSDCVAREDWLSGLVAGLAPQPVQIVLGAVEPASASRALAMIGAYQHLADSYIFSSDDRRLYYGQTGNMAVRRDLFSRIGLLDDRPLGADSMFVRRTLDRFGPESVRYCPEPRVQHLELDSAGAYFRKTFKYGRIRRLVGMRPLTPGERLELFRATLTTERYSLAEAGLLLVLLSAALACHALGKLSAIRQSRERDEQSRL